MQQGHLCPTQAYPPKKSPPISSPSSLHAFIVKKPFKRLCHHLIHISVRHLQKRKSRGVIQYKEVFLCYVAAPEGLQALLAGRRAGLEAAAADMTPNRVVSLPITYLLLSEIQTNVS